MNNIYRQVDYIIFDLDGTLYEDTKHFSYYAEQLKKELNPEQWQAFDVEYEKIISGNHIVSIGKVYDVIRDQVLHVDSSSMEVLQAWTWDGTPIDKEKRNKDYSAPLTCDFDSMIAIGDGWWLPNVCAKHFGVIDTYSAYERTKEYMASDQFQLTRIPRLREALLHLKVHKRICLLTNSQPDDVQRLLNRLNLEGIFDELITEAKKPQYTINHFHKIMDNHQLKPEQCLSVGDNYMNEIAPAIRLGMNTIFIDFYKLVYPDYKGVKVRSIADTLDHMLDL